jgi:hypothetical protein
LNQNRAVGFGNIRENLKNILDLPVFADDVFQRVLPRKLLSKGLDGREISKGFDPSDDLTFFISQDCGADADGDFFAFFIDDCDRKIYDLFFCFNGLFQRTFSQADIRPKDVITILTNGFFACVSGYPLRCLIDKGDFALIIYRKNAIRNAVQNDLEYSRFFDGFHQSISNQTAFAGAGVFF